MSESIKWKELTPEQRDALVSEKVIGLELKECDGSMGEQPNSSDGWFCMKCGYEGCWGDSFDHRELPCHYTQSLDAAWLVVQRFTVGVELACLPGSTTSCRISAICGKPSFGVAHHPAEAICKAALEAMGYEVR